MPLQPLIFAMSIIPNSPSLNTSQVSSAPQNVPEVGNHSVAVSNQALLKNTTTLATQSLANMHQADKTRLVSLTHDTSGRGFFGSIKQIVLNIGHNIKHLLFKEFRDSAVNTLNHSTNELESLAHQITHSKQDFSGEEGQKLINVLENAIFTNTADLYQKLGYKTVQSQKQLMDLIDNLTQNGTNRFLEAKLALKNPINKAIVDSLGAMIKVHQSLLLSRAEKTEAKPIAPAQENPVEIPAAKTEPNVSPILNSEKAPAQQDPVNIHPQGNPVQPKPEPKLEQPQEHPSNPIPSEPTSPDSIHSNPQPNPEPEAPKVDHPVNHEEIPNEQPPVQKPSDKKDSVKLNRTNKKPTSSTKAKPKVATKPTSQTKKGWEITTETNMNKEVKAKLYRKGGLSYHEPYQDPTINFRP